MWIVVNRRAQMKVILLPHEVYCEALGACQCTVLPGKASVRVPQCLTLPAEGRSVPVPNAVLKIPQLARALQRGEVIAERLRVVRSNTRPRVSPKPSGRTRRTARRKGKR